MDIVELKKLADKVGCTADCDAVYVCATYTCHNAPAIVCSSCATGGAIRID